VKVFAALFLLTFCIGVQAQTRNDPLNPREVEQMRDNARNPQQRVDLLLWFARNRMLAIDRLRGAKPGSENAEAIADLFSDLASLIDELDDNLSMYNGHSEDLRRPLRHVLDVEGDFQKKLTALDQNATPVQKRRLAIALQDVTDSLETSAENARAMLADQIQKKGEERGKERLDRKEARQAEHPVRQSTEDAGSPDYTGMGGIGQTPPH